MNSSRGDEINSEFVSEEAVFMQLGSTPIMDLMNAVVLTGVSLIGASLSLLSFLIFINRQAFDKSARLFIYLRVYTFTNILLCLLNISAGLTATNRMLNFTTTYLAQVYFNYFISSISNLVYFYNSIISIIILLDRIAYFNPTTKKTLEITSPMRICLFSFIIIALIDVPYYLSYSVEFSVFRLNSTTNLSLWHSSKSEFLISHTGRSLSFIVTVFRDLLVLLVEIVLNIASLFLLKNHFRKKLLKQKAIVSTGSVEKSSRVDQIEAKKRPSQSPLETRVTQADLKATLMVIVICFSSITSHVCTVIPVVVSFYVDYSFTSYILYYLQNISLSFKCSIDFGVFLIFNQNFKRVFLNYIRIR